MKRLLLLCLIVINLNAMRGYRGTWIDVSGNPVVNEYDFKAMIRGDTFDQCAKERIASKKDLDKPVEGHGQTLLEFFGYDSSMIKKLLEAGATANGEVLAKAVWGDNLKTALVLLKYKADPNARYQGLTALHYVCMHSKDILPYNRSNLVALLLSRGANPNSYDRYHQTPLHHLFLHFTCVDRAKPRARIERKRIIHGLIFGGAHLKTDLHDSQLPVERTKKKTTDPDLIALAAYAEQQYVSRMLQLCHKSKQPNIIKTLPRELLKHCADQMLKV